MNRLSVIVLGAAMIAGAANAAEVRINTAGLSASEVRTAIASASFKACKEAYKGDVFADYERDGCVDNTYRASLAKLKATESAERAQVRQTSATSR